MLSTRPNVGAQGRALAWPSKAVPQFDASFPDGAAPAPPSTPAASAVVRPLKGAWTRPVQAADVAQARSFDAIMQSEIEELEDLAASAEQRWLRRCQRGLDDLNRPPEALLRLRGRIDEAERIVEALRARFVLD